MLDRNWTTWNVVEQSMRAKAKLVGNLELLFNHREVFCYEATNGLKNFIPAQIIKSYNLSNEN